MATMRVLHLAASPNRLCYVTQWDWVRVRFEEDPASQMKKERNHI